MKHLRPLIGLLVCAAALAGCSDAPRDTWYEDASRHTQERDLYIREQVLEGIPEHEARATADLNFYIENTIRPKDQLPEPEAPSGY